MLEKYYTKARKVIANNQSEKNDRRRRTRGRGARGKERGTRSPECCTGDNLASFRLNSRNHKRRAMNHNALLMTTQNR